MEFESIRFACTALTQLFNTKEKSCSCFGNCSLLYQHRTLREARVFQYLFIVIPAPNVAGSSRVSVTVHCYTSTECYRKLAWNCSLLYQQGMLQEARVFQ